MGKLADIIDPSVLHQVTDDTVVSTRRACMHIDDVVTQRDYLDCTKHVHAYSPAHRTRRLRARLRRRHFPVPEERERAALQRVGLRLVRALFDLRPLLFRDPTQDPQAPRPLCHRLPGHRVSLT